MARKLVFVISDLGSGGAQQVAVRMINHFAHCGWDCTLLTLDGGESDFFVPAEQVRCIRLGLAGGSSGLADRLLSNSRRLINLRQALKSISPDVVMSFIAPTNCLVLLSTLGLRFKVVISERNDPASQSFGLFWDVARKCLYRFSDMVTANSRSALSHLAGYVPGRKLMYLPNPIRELVLKDAIKPLGARQKYLIAVGRLHVQKNHVVMLRAFAACIGELDGWRLLIVGDGELSVRLKLLVQELGISSNVDFCGRIAEPDFLLGQSSIFLMPSLYEGQPNALLEAMRAGCVPIVSDKIPDIHNILDNGKCGILCDPHDEVAWSRQIVRLCSCLELRECMASQGIRRSRDWNLEGVSDIWHGLLQ